MTREEAKSFWRIKYENAKNFSDPHWEAQERREHREYVEALRIAAEHTDCTDFVNWLLEEVMDEEMWELNAVANGEVIARKLKKLGLLEVKDGYYIRPSADAVQVVRCGQCEHWKCNPCTSEYGVCNKASYDEFEVIMHSDDFCSYGRNRQEVYI